MNNSTECENGTFAVGEVSIDEVEKETAQVARHEAEEEKSDLSRKEFADFCRILLVGVRLIMKSINKVLRRDMVWVSIG